jgi:metal-dependent amidase/aminoacylase/carboxypeptidase family protein
MYPPVINDEGLYDIFKELIPPESRVRFRKVMLSEDFSYFQKEVPGLYIGLGTGNEEKGYNKNLHTSDFNFDETVLLKGLEASLKFINYLKKY